MKGYRLTNAPTATFFQSIFRDMSCSGKGRRIASMTLHALFKKLADHPDMARVRSEITPAVRAFSFKSHVVIFEDTTGGVVILSVRHGHEDWQNDPLGSKGRMDGDQ